MTVDGTSMRETFRARFLDLVERRGEAAGPKAFVAAGMSRTSYYNLLNNPEAPLPNSENLARLSVALRTTPDYLLGFDDKLQIERTTPPNSEIERLSEALLKEVFSHATAKMMPPEQLDIKDVLSWWRENDGKLKNTRKIDPFVDVFAAPEPTDSILRPVRMGSESLATKTLTTDTADRLRVFMQALPKPMLDQIMFSYASAAQKDPGQAVSVSEHTLSVHVPDFGQNYDLHYWKVMLPVVDGLGNRYVMNFSTSCD